MAAERMSGSKTDGGLPQSSLFLVPLIPSVISMVMSLAGTIVLDVTLYNDCSDSNGQLLQAFVIGSVILGYAFSFYHGVTLVGPDWVSAKVSILVYITHASVLLCWSILGSTSVAMVSNDCKGTALWGMGVAFLPTYFVLAIVHIIVGSLGICKGVVAVPTFGSDLNDQEGENKLA